MSRSVEIIAFKPEHRLEIHEAQAVIGCNATPELWEAVAHQGGSITLRIDGVTVMCGGIVEYEPGQYEAWAAIDAHSHRHALTIHRTALDILNSAVETFGRIRALVVTDKFPEGHRWVQALGFKFEGTVSGVRPDGRDCAVYALGD